MKGDEEPPKVHRIIFDDGTIFRAENKFLQYLIQAERERQR